MKRKILILAAALLLGGLAGCGQENPKDNGTSSTLPSDSETTVRCRIVEGAKDGDLLLASLNSGSGIYRLTVSDTPVTVDGKQAEAEDLADGMEVTITYGGSVQESYPMGFGTVAALDARSPAGGSYYDLCGFYLKVLEDLWNTDPGLNEDLTYIGVDLSKAPGGLTDSEKEAIAWRFAQLHSCTPLTGTYDQLAEQGYIDREKLDWKDGLLFSISAADSSDEKYALPTLRFDAQKWRGGDGADFFNDCTAVWPEFGAWTEYSVGSHAIS